MKTSFVLIAVFVIPALARAQSIAPTIPTIRLAAPAPNMLNCYPEGNTIKVPGDYPTIQEAIDAALNGDIVLVAPGAYHESINFLGKAITVSSEQGPDITFITGGGGSVVTFANNEDAGSVLCGFTITGGYTGGCGGGIYCKDASPRIMNCSITGNQAEVGGGIYCLGSSPLLMNNLISNNSAVGLLPAYGGGICFSSNSNAVLVNNTISNNSAGDLMMNSHGGGIFVESSSPVLVNSILYFNYTDYGKENIYVQSGIPTLTYCNVQGSWPGTGNIDADPLFVDGYHLQQNPCQPGIVNPCVDAGDPATSMINGTTRSDGYHDVGVVDMGYHYPHLVALFVPEEYVTIQSAIDAANNGELVFVSTTGTYMENIDFKGKAITVKSFHGAESTIIDGNYSASVATFQSGEGGDTVLSGFTITHGGAMDGGGIFCSGSSPTISDNIISECSASQNGGGIFCYGASPTISNSTISECSASQNGGGIYCYEASPTVDNNMVTLNTASVQGGGIHCMKSDAVIQNNTITSNKSYLGAGGIGCVASSPTIVNNLLTENQSPWGGGMGCAGSNSVIVNNVIAENAANSGGGIYTDDTSFLSISNNLLINNTATVQGGGIDCGNGFSVIINTILWNNDALTGPQIHGANPVVSYCVVEGGWPGTENIDADPLLIDPLNGDFHIPVDSPCVDHGDLTAPGLVETDFEGDPRIIYGFVDIGPDEYGLGGKVHHVPETYPSIQEAVDYALDKDTVLVSPGTYVENIHSVGKDIILMSEKGPEATVLDGNQSGSVVTFTNGSGQQGTMISGFTITNGLASRGGGICCLDSSTDIFDNIIKDNTATDMGGGVYSNSSYSIANNIITNNSAVNDGGGICCMENWYFNISGNTVKENEAGQRGGGISVEDIDFPPKIIISSNTITSNLANVGGGGIHYDIIQGDALYYRVYIMNNIINSNSAIKYGGGIYCTGNSVGCMINNTITGNSVVFSGGYGGGICCLGNMEKTVVNTILFDNSAKNGPEICLVLTAYLEISHSDMLGGLGSVYTAYGGILDWGSGMLDADPLFIDPQSGDLHLTSVSPCIDVGDNSALFLPALDFEGDPRIFPGNGTGIYPLGSPPQAANVDMGADEYCLLKRQNVIPK